MKYLIDFIIPNSVLLFYLVNDFTKPYRFAESQSAQPISNRIIYDLPLSSVRLYPDKTDRGAAGGALPGLVDKPPHLLSLGRHVDVLYA